MQMKYPKIWLVIALLVSLLGFMLIIVKHNNGINIERQQKIYDHSEITDTI